MFKRSYNRAILRIELRTVSPLLIKAGDSGLGPTAAQLACVRTRHADAGVETTVYIPGSSLRGVVRAAAEASLAGKTFVNHHGPVDGYRDPFDTASGRSIAGGPPPPTAEIHRSHPLTMRLFGSTSLKSRCSIRDLFPWSPGTARISQADTFTQANRTELRNNVAIDRVLGSVKHGPWDAELVPAGVSFWGDLALENYEVWQLGLLARAFDELNDGFAQLGSGKSRGLGVVRLTVTTLVHEQAARAGARPHGVAHLADAETRRAYDLFSEPPDALPIADGEPRGLHRRFTVTDAAPWLDAGRRALAPLESPA
ncbi:RAMP superfamily CRISPR-associated protein [Nannocystis sp. RBIL2]|uniref:RAMP superfamily CRISPR-associated protein n=1 Tax=Nannocystis sp. RBIL2 TaxID=2996788 RepID=UPI002270A783|nr:RAMP superfamily CRISPR-associated protein [Nannocystis sp. RBIL2]MCY1071206.1 RAMP superfamily CRISPR-associated protein [Nannocystis sp. RBIL2]